MPENVALHLQTLRCYCGFATDRCCFIGTFHLNAVLTQYDLNTAIHSKHFAFICGVSSALGRRSSPRVWYTATRTELFRIQTAWSSRAQGSPYSLPESGHWGRGIRKQNKLREKLTGSEEVLKIPPPPLVLVNMHCSEKTRSRFGNCVCFGNALFGIQDGGQSTGTQMYYHNFSALCVQW
jgi:hypothetical protein